MISVNICLKNEKDALNFSNILCKYPINADMKVGKSQIDPKSIIGLFALGIAKPAKLYIYAESAPMLMDDIRTYII